MSHLERYYLRLFVVGIPVAMGVIAGCQKPHQVPLSEQAFLGRLSRGQGVILERDEPPYVISYDSSVETMGGTISYTHIVAGFADDWIVLKANRSKVETKIFRPWIAALVDRNPALSIAPDKPIGAVGPAAK